MRLCQKIKIRHGYEIVMRCEHCETIWKGVADDPEDFKPEKIEALYCPGCGMNSKFETKAEKKF